ncbi:PaaI family thioesterase [Weissella sagaensis]|jgi:uncharacterized protein (TIGR00369 family)|uniref:PaaI family thioesterase n=1 Tax=Weissella sagaensis TaxID=2559928 RepID=UPI0012396B2A|nr:PaaI family thioesterase [Weissella sagaensis]KAA8434538.1 PaaI family thioesterase [Weissella paramesenteroides]KAA8437497.1 PaaI family thioesterase [Weissella paramesenteroides]MBU7567536.1 PaaI family thioesterase [Weissella hellenica]
MNALEYLNVQFDTISATKTIIRLPISDNIKQPYGIVHGGINAFLAETAASLGAQATMIDDTHVPVGVDIHTHHLSPADKGTLLAIATPIKLGHRIQTWQVNIFIEETQQQTATSTVTIMVTSKP